MRALVIQTAFLGDVVLTSPFLVALRAKWPGIALDVVSTPAGCEALEGLDGVRCHALDKRGKGLFRGMNDVLTSLGRSSFGSPVFDVVFCVHRSPRSLLLGRRVAARRRVAFASTWSRLMGYETVPFPEYDATVHYADKPLALLDVFGPRPATPRPWLAVSPDAERTLREKTSALFTAGGYVVLSPFSAWGTKMWFADRFVRLGAELSRARGLPIVVIGGGDAREAVVGDAIASKIVEAGGKALSLAGRTSIAELKALIRSASLLIANDSAPVHVASAFDVPTVAIFGPTARKWGFFPLSASHAVVERKDLACRPCHIHGPSVCPLGHFRCMGEIQVEDVSKAVEELMSDIWSKA